MKKETLRIPELKCIEFPELGLVTTKEKCQQCNACGRWDN